MALICEKDWEAASKALKGRDRFTLTRTLGSVEMTVSVEPAGKGWEIPMVIGVMLKIGGEIRTRQWCSDIEQAKETVRRWGR